ncbi:MAG: MBL fold metallo-hydrolase [Spirochaetaceae bacterium]|nr:MBL fold metallo-hydrolase [Spirochaetaceae bacterium]
MKITSLLENTTERENLKTEHGLSLYIETEEKKILFDMGQGTAFGENAKILNVNLATVDVAILSHGHYDHGGGLETFLKINSTAPVYIQRDAFCSYHNFNNDYIGLDSSLKNNPRIIFTQGKISLSATLTLFTAQELSKTPWPHSGNLKERVKEKFIADDFRHEQYLLIEENNKRVLISGCSHKGILNIMETFSPDVLIGGFHFFHLTLEETLEASQQLCRFNTDFYTCHCTGVSQFEFMKKTIPNLKYFSCGQTITI